MSESVRPQVRPLVPHFSSGPCAKRPGWSPAALADVASGRSHRAKIGKAKLGQVITDSAAILGLPAGWRLGIVPASDTGAVEMALWSLLGARGVDMLAWESFGETWVGDVKKQLKLDDVRVFTAPYGQIPDLSLVGFDRDVVFTWNGTTAGVRLPDGDWIADDRAGLTICDATSAAFAMDLPWHKLDVVTWSWQKVLGGEGAHGMLVLSPRAVERLESHVPAWPLPKIFRMTSGGKLIEGIFQGDTINTPSMLAVEDQLDALAWARTVGGLPGLMARCETNRKTVQDWLDGSDWAVNLAADPRLRSTTQVCLTFKHPALTALSVDAQAAFAKKIVSLLDAEGVAYDVGSYRDAPPGLRIWTGATIERADLAALLPWLDWAFAQVLAQSK